MNKVLIGKILKPKGLDGTLKITNFTLGELASSFKSVFVDGKCYSVLRAYCAKEFVYIKVDGIYSVEEAQRFREKEIYGDRDDLSLGQNQFLKDDLIGLDVFINDQKFGTIEDIENYGAGDIIVIRAVYGRSVMVPKTDRLIERINLSENKIEMNKEEFDGVKCEN